MTSDRNTHATEILFRSVTLLLGAGEDGGYFADRDLFVAWLEEGRRYFMAATGVANGHNLHRVYGSTLTVNGIILDRMPWCEDFLGLVSVAAARTAMGLQVQIPLSRNIGALFSVIDLLRRLKAISTVIVDGRDAEVEEDGTSVLGFVERLISEGRAVVLIGPLALWRRVGVTASLVTNSRNIQIIPTQTTAHRVPTPIVADPCVRRYQAIVAPDGFVYGCSGLLGLRQFSLGHLSSHIEYIRHGAVFGPCDEAYGRWATAGPTAGELTDSPNAMRYLPPVCAAHRSALALATFDERKGAIVASESDSVGDPSTRLGTECPTHEP